MNEILFMFMMFSMIGWMWETPWVSFHEKRFINRGFLFGPYIPIYGCAIITIILSMSIFDDIELSIINVVLIIIYMALVTAVWEYVTSYVMEKMFHTRWWDYSRHPFNLNGRICLHVSLFFGIGGFIIWNFVYPLFLSLYQYIPNMELNVFLVLFYIIFGIDSYITTRELFKVKGYITVLENASKELLNSLETSFVEMKVSFKEYKLSLQETMIEVKRLIEQKYKDSKVPQTAIIKEQFIRLNNLFSKQTVTRFMKKYPSSKSRRLIKLKEWYKDKKKEV